MIEDATTMEEQLERTVLWQRVAMQLRNDMERIMKWDLPRVLSKRDGKYYEYGHLYGSNGERDYIIGIAKGALKRWETEHAMYQIEQQFK